MWLGARQERGQLPASGGGACDEARVLHAHAHARVLASVEVYEAQVVRDDPFKRVEVQRALEAGDRGNETLRGGETRRGASS